MKKIIARQIDCEFFDWEAYLDENTLAEADIWVGGNKDFNGLNNELFAEAEDLLKGCDYDIGTCWDDFDDEDPNYDNKVYEAQLEVIANYANINDRSKLEKLLELVEEYRHNYFDTESEIQLYCKVLGILKDKNFNYTLLRGYSQGDWIYCIYPEGTTQEYLDFIEAVYFGTGTEFEISFNEVELDDYTYGDGKIDVDTMFDSVDTYCDYTTAWKDEDIKSFIAKSAGVSESEIVVFEISTRRQKIEHDYQIL